MREVVGNLWTYPADIRVITTNGTVKANGECVMGRGCAAEAKRMFPGLALALGQKIQQYGNHVFYLGEGLYSLPVKHNWWEKADIELIRVKAEELSACVSDGFPDNQEIRVVLPRPGCGNGGLRWADVKPILAPILDDRFHVITFK
jgi:hypothetical protein